MVREHSPGRASRAGWSVGGGRVVRRGAMLLPLLLLLAILLPEMSTAQNALRATVNKLAAAGTNALLQRDKAGDVSADAVGGGDGSAPQSTMPKWTPGQNLTPKNIATGVGMLVKAGQTVQAVVDNSGVAYSDTQGALQFKFPSLKNSVLLDLMSQLVSGVIGSSSKLTPEQQRSLIDLVTRSVDGFNDFMSVRCAWHATVSSRATDDNPRALNIAFPDAWATYHVLYLPPLNDNTTYIIQGVFPRVRYFSYQSYDAKYDPIKSMRDYEIKPVKGMNPFSTNTANSKTPITDNVYQLIVTKDGSRGFINEFGTRLPGDTSSSSRGSFIILRLYAYDDSSPRPDSVWGGVDPPTVRVLLKGTLTKEFAANYQDKSNDGYTLWGSVPKCPPANTAFIADFVAQAVNIMSSNASTNPCARYNQENNFALFKRTGKRVPFPNNDAAYLLACGQAKGLDGDFVAVVSGLMPLTPEGLVSPPFVADPSSYDTRYLSVSSVNMQEPGPVLQTLWDKDLVHFYSGKHGSAKAWADKTQRRFRIVIAPSVEVARRCGLWSDDSMWLTSLDSQGRPIDYPGVIFRELLSKEMIMNVSEDPSAVNSVFKIKNQGCAKEPDNCTTAAFAARYMDENYPTYKAYDCLWNGKAQPARTASSQPRQK